MRPGFFCPGLARPDISNRFRCDPILDRKQAGGARCLGPPHFEDVDSLFWGQPDSARRGRRLKLKMLDRTIWQEAWSTQQWHALLETLDESCWGVLSLLRRSQGCCSSNYAAAQSPLASSRGGAMGKAKCKIRRPEVVVIKGKGVCEGDLRAYQLYRVKLCVKRWRHLAAACMIYWHAASKREQSRAVWHVM